MQPKLIISLLIGGLAVLIAVFLITPKIQEVRGARAIISEQREVIQEITDRIDLIGKELKEFEELSDADTELIFKALPESLDTPNLLFNLESVSSSAGLVAESISILGGILDGQAEVSGAGPTTISGLRGAGITMSIRGGYEAFKDFLKKLESNLRLFDIQTIAFSVSEEAQESIRFDVAFRTYYVEN